MGVVYYANYFIWFEIGRVEFLRQMGFDYKNLETEQDCHLPVVEANCRYKSPARYDDQIVIETRILALRPSLIKFAYRVLLEAHPEEKLLAEGETTHVVVDRSMQKRPLPGQYLEALKAAHRKG